MVNKVVFEDFAVKVLAAVDATKDGVSFDDVDEGFAVLMAVKDVVAEFQKDKVVAGLRCAEAFAGTVATKIEAV